MERPSAIRLTATVGLGMLAVSSGSILVKWAQEAPSLAIAFYRMFWAGLILLPVYWRNKDRGVAGIRGLTAWRLLAAVALALHFAFWIGSLRYTSVAVSVLLVNTSPILVAGVSYFLFKERLTRRGWLGIALALAGSATLLHRDLTRLGDLRGAGLALAGAAALGLYLIAGRKVQSALGLWNYVYPTYLLAAVILLATTLLSGAAVGGFSGRTWLFLFLLGLIPQSVGHTCYNWSLKHLPATVVSALVLAEPALAPLLAWRLLGEALGWAELLGGLLVGAGILLVSVWGVSKQA